MYKIKTLPNQSSVVGSKYIYQIQILLLNQIFESWASIFLALL